MLLDFNGIGPEFTTVLWSEGLFRHFDNRRQISCASVELQYLFLAVIADPSSSKAEEWSEWMDRDFDPKEFSVEVVNSRIAARLTSLHA